MNFLPFTNKTSVTLKPVIPGIDEDLSASEDNRLVTGGFSVFSTLEAEHVHISYFYYKSHHMDASHSSEYTLINSLAGITSHTGLTQIKSFSSDKVKKSPSNFHMDFIL